MVAPSCLNLGATAPGKGPAHGVDRHVAVSVSHGGDALEMDLAQFRSFANDSGVARHFQAQLRAEREKKTGGKSKTI